MASRPNSTDLVWYDSGEVVLRWEVAVGRAEAKREEQSLIALLYLDRLMDMDEDVTAIGRFT